MTEEQLLAIEARANAATPGPWQFSGLFYQVCSVAAHPPIVLIEDYRGPNPRSDRIFIAHARTDVPALAAEVRSLRDQLQIWRNPDMT